MIASQSKNSKPLLSVWMITYNHEEYISKALESVLMQKVNFPIEIVIGEDCSSDGTIEIIKKYILKYPNIIRARFNKTNIGMMPNVIQTLKECKGKYIALLEGDDYWIDENKLQKQVDFLESHEDFSFCFHNVYKDENGKKILFVEKYDKDIFSTEDLFKLWFIPTGSICLRAECMEYPSWLYNIFNGDLAITYLLSKKGKIKLIDGIMGVYRTHNGGISYHIKPAKLLLNLAYLFKTIDIETNHKYIIQIEDGLANYIINSFEDSFSESFIKNVSTNKVNISKLKITHIFRLLFMKFLNRIKC